MLLSLLLFLKLMNSQIQNKKNIQLTHLLQSVKIHKQEYIRRPLSVATAPVYLNSLAYLSQLMPTFLSHYHEILKRQQLNSLTTELTLLFQDIMMKLKSTVDKLQARYNQSVMYKHSELVKVEDNKQNPKLNETNDVSQMANTHDMIQLKLREQTETFTPLENKIFYQQLKEALQKKQEVLAICHSQSFEFADFLDAQIQDILTLKQGLIFRLEKQGQRVNSEELKKEVSNSLKQQWRKKLPEITRLIEHKILKSLQKNKKLDIINIGMQTQDVQNVKIIQLNRKIFHLQKVVKDQKESNQKLILSCQQKELLIKKMEGQLQQTGEQYHKKQYEMQKSIKNLQESSRRQKQQYQKQKSRKILKLKQQNEQKAQVQKSSEVTIQAIQRSQMIRKTNQTINKSAKYIISSINKIEQKDVQLTSKTSKDKTILKPLRSQRINQAILTQILSQKSRPESQQKRQNKQTSINSKKATPRQAKSKQKQIKRVNEKHQLLEIKSNTNKNKIQNKVVQNEIKKISRNTNIVQRVIPNNNKQKSSLSKKNQVRLPSINRNKNVANKPQNQFNAIQCDQDKSGRKMTARFFEGDIKRQKEPSFNQACQQPSNITLKSTVSLIGNEYQREKIVKRQDLQTSIQQKAERQRKNYSQFKKRDISFQNNNLTERVKIPREREKQYNILHQYQLYQKQNHVNPGIKKESPELTIDRRVMTQLVGKQQKSDSTEQLKICLKLLMSLFLTKSQGGQSISQLKNKLEQMIQRKDSYLISYDSQSPIIRNRSKIHQNSYNIKANVISNDHSDKIKKSKIGLTKFLNKSLTEGPDRELNHFKMGYFKKQMHKPQIYPNIQLTVFQQRGFSPIPNKRLSQKQSTQQKHSLSFTNILFLNQQMAFQYQTAFSKKINKITRKLTEEVQSFGSQLFKILQRLRISDKTTYQKVCRQLRYPFSRGHRKFIQIQIVSGMSAVVVNQCLQILATLHKKCNSQIMKCQHFRQFKLKLEKLAIFNKK